jgi:hypothetical protein
MDKDAGLKFRSELEEAREASVRADFYSGGGLSTGGEDRRRVIRQWLREKERERECYARWTSWVAVSALVASVIGVFEACLTNKEAAN